MWRLRVCMEPTDKINYSTKLWILAIGSHSRSWPQTKYVAEGGFELPILPSLPQGWGAGIKGMQYITSFIRCWGPNHKALFCARQAFYQLSSICRSTSVKFNKAPETVGWRPTELVGVEETLYGTPKARVIRHSRHNHSSNPLPSLLHITPTPQRARRTHG